MNKTDIDFIKKVSKLATDAMKTAEEAKAIAEKALAAAPPATPASTVIAGATEPTQTWVQFGTPQELQQHASSIMLLNQDVDKLCKALKVKELRITFKAP